GAAGYVAYQTFHAQDYRGRTDESAEAPSRAPLSIRMVLSRVPATDKTSATIRIELSGNAWSYLESASDADKDRIWESVSGGTKVERYLASVTGAAIAAPTASEAAVPDDAIRRAFEAFARAGLSQVTIEGGPASR